MESFQILIKMKSAKVFQFFDQRYDRTDQKMDHEELLEIFIIALLEIDSKKTVHYMLKETSTETQQKNLINKYVVNIKGK